jgi:hypothetical protein
LTTSRENAYFLPDKVLTKMTKASSIFIFIFVVIDILIHKESRNTEMFEDKNNNENRGRSGLTPKVPNQWSVIG